MADRWEPGQVRFLGLPHRRAAIVIAGFAVLAALFFAGAVLSGHPVAFAAGGCCLGGAGTAFLIEQGIPEWAHRRQQRINDRYR
ncbi:MAG: hypothetical protein U0547_02210 [Dehalococcoidia bacterium]